MTTATKEMLAIHGGAPVRKALLPYGHQTIEESDVEAVVEVLRSDWLTTGPKVAEFEERFAAYVDAKFAVSFCSGTAALHAAIFAAGLGPDDEAITSPLTFVATANCVLYQDATPVFADVSQDTLNLDPDSAASKVGPRTKAILPVDYAGHPADMDAFRKIANEHHLLLIEDAAHSLGGKYRGKAVGSLADMTTFSFHPVKHLTTGEGGMVTTNDAGLAESLRLFRNHGISSDARARQQAGQWYYEMIALGFNYRLTDIGCALGASQLPRLAENVARRSSIAKRYTDAFVGMPGIFAPEVRQGVNPAWHLYPIRLDLARLTADRAEIFRAFRSENIGVNVHYIPVHLHPYYRDRFAYKSGDFPVAESAYERLISLPMFHGMTDQDVQDVIQAVTKVVSHFTR